MLVDVWITCRYFVRNDYSELLGQKHNSVLAKQKVFCEKVNSPS